MKRALAVLAASLLALLALATAAAAWQGARAPTGRPEYVALGSSFAAGAGLGRLQPGSPLLCARSVNGYPQQLARLRGLSIVDMSCGGAVTRNLLYGGQFFQGPQLRSIGAATRLVTITVGGNDVGYIGDLLMSAMRNVGTPLNSIVRWLWKGPKPLGSRDFGRLQSDLIDDPPARAGRHGRGRHLPHHPPRSGNLRDAGPDRRAS